MRAAPTLLPLFLAGCWALDLPSLPVDRVAFTPAVGAPEGWKVEGFPIGITCPDDVDARFYVVYPESADRRVDAGAPALPLAIVFHSGATDFVFEPDTVDPTASLSWQESLDRGPRLEAAWAARRVFATLGMYPNYDPSELHAGTLAAALAAKGIASLWPTNCWGDIWHNRSSLVTNDVDQDKFIRDGRTAAEFAWLHAITAFPPGNPLDLPLRVDAERLYLIGLGDGGRAVGELLSAITPSGDFAYHAAGVVLDHPIDDWSVLWSETNLAEETLSPQRTWAERVFPGGEFMQGAFSRLPGAQRTRPDLPLRRIGLLLAEQDAGLPDGTNDELRRRFTASPADPDAPKSQPQDDIWVHETADLVRPFSNVDPALAKAIADFLGAPLDARGIDAVSPDLID